MYDQLNEFVETYGLAYILSILAEVCAERFDGEQAYVQHREAWLTMVNSIEAAAQPATRLGLDKPSEV